MARKIRKHAGLVGLGIIGSRVAAALRAGGYRTYVWNRTPKAEPNFLGSPAEVAEVCEVVQLFVSDANALFEVLDAMAPALGPSHVIVCNATVGPEATVEAAQMVAGCGAKFLDAPFTGSRVAAERRELTYFIGGDDETLAIAEPVLRASGSNIVKIGAIGQAATMKVATNMLVGVTVQALAEALAVVRKSGIEPALLGDALAHHAVRSGLIDLKLPKILAGDFEPQFSLKHMFKDVQLAIQIANALELDIPTTTATAGVMYGALAQGWQDLDFSSVAKMFADEGDVPVSSGEEEESTPVQPPLESPSNEEAEGAPAVQEPAKNGTPAEMEPEPSAASDSAADEEKRDGGKTAPQPPAPPAAVSTPEPEVPKEAPSLKPAGEPAVQVQAAQPRPATEQAGVKKTEETQAYSPLPEPGGESVSGKSDAPPTPEDEAPAAQEEPPQRPLPVFNRVRRWFGNPGA